MSDPADVLSEAELTAKAAQFLASLDMNKKTDVGLRDYKGKVVLIFMKPETYVVLEPQMAFTVAEQMARAAHRARFPEERMPDDFSYLAQQIKQRLTDDMRDRLQIRIAKMLPSILERKDLIYASKQLIDTVFSALDAESYTKLDPKGGVKYDA